MMAAVSRKVVTVLMVMLRIRRRTKRGTAESSYREDGAACQACKLEKVMAENGEEEIAGIIDRLGVMSDRLRDRLVDRLVEARQVFDVGIGEGRAADPLLYDAGPQRPIF